VPRSCLVCCLLSLTRPRPPSPLDPLAARALSSQPPLSSALDHSGARPLWRPTTLALIHSRVSWSSALKLRHSAVSCARRYSFILACVDIHSQMPPFTSFDLLLASSLACLLVCACVLVCVFGSAITHRCCNTSALGCSTLCCPSARCSGPDPALSTEEICCHKRETVMMRCFNKCY